MAVASPLIGKGHLVATNDTNSYWFWNTFTMCLSLYLQFCYKHAECREITIEKLEISEPMGRSGFHLFQLSVFPASRVFITENKDII